MIASIHSWLVVSNIVFIFHITWDNPSHWLSYFPRWLLHHQPDRLLTPCNMLLTFDRGRPKLDGALGHFEAASAQMFPSHGYITHEWIYTYMCIYVYIYIYILWKLKTHQNIKIDNNQSKTLIPTFRNLLYASCIHIYYHLFTFRYIYNYTSKPNRFICRRKEKTWAGKVCNFGTSPGTVGTVEFTQETMFLYISVPISVFDCGVCWRVNLALQSTFQ